MTRLGEIIRLYARVETPVSRFAEGDAYREYQKRALAWAGNASIFDLANR